MAKEAFETVLHHIRALTDARGETCRSDADLLERFIAHREEEAFADLMRRNGPMVLAVCQRALGHPQDAEDAFQATFMLLARRAHSIRRKESLAAWLHGVARRVAGKARRAMIRRRERERRAARPIDAAGARAACTELEAELDEALLRLPDKYRTAILLCYFEGRTVDEAARELGCPRGTVASRLAQARVLLRRHLARRGLVLAEGALITYLVSGASATVTAALARATVEAGAKFAAGAAANAVASPSVAALVSGTLRGMVLSNVKMAAIVLLLFAGVVAGVAGTREHDLPDAPQQPASPAAAGDETTQPRTDAAGDSLPASAVARIGTLRFRHPDHVKTLAFSPDARVVMSQAGGDIRFWDTGTGKELRRLSDLRQISACDLSPDGKTVALLRSPDGNASRMILGLWDVGTGRLLRTLSEGQIRSWVRFAPDGKTLLTDGRDRTGSSSVQLWDLATGKARSLKVPDGVQSAIFNGAGTLVITTGSDGTTRFWDVATGKETRKLRTGAVSVGRLAVSPDGGLLATVGSTWEKLDGVPGSGGFGFSEEIDRFIRIWDVAAGKELRRLTTPKTDEESLFWGGGIQFAPDGKTLFSNGPGRALRAWDVFTGKELRTMPLDCYAAWGLAVSRDGKLLATAAGGLTIRLFDAHTGKDLAPPGHNQLGVGTLILSPDGRHLIAQNDGGNGIEIWDPREARLRRRLESGETLPTDLCLGGDGTTLFSAGSGKDVSVWDIAKAAPLRTIPVGASKFSRNLAVTPDAKLLALATNKSVRLLDASTGAELKELTGHEPFVIQMYFIEDSKKLVVCSADNKCHIWDTTSGRRLSQFSLRQTRQTDFGLPPPPGTVTSYTTAISPDQRLIAYGSQGRYLSLRELATGKELATFANLPDGVCPLVFSEGE